MKTLKTLKELAQNALDVQSACNLSGVVHSFSSDISDLRLLLTQAAKTQSEVPGTEEINTHPIAILYAVKISHLTKTNVCVDNFEDYSKAYDWCMENAK